MKNRTLQRRRAGFTLAETLMTTLILLMVTAIVAAGIPAAVNAYDKVLDAANAQILLSSAISRLEEELSTAVEVWTKTENGETKFDAYSHYKYSYKISLDNDNTEGITIKYTVYKNDKVKIPVARPLVTLKTLTTNRRTGNTRYYVSFESIEYDDSSGLFTVSDLKVKEVGAADDADPKAIQPILVIRPVTKPDLNP